MIFIYVLIALWMSFCVGRFISAIEIECDDISAEKLSNMSKQEFLNEVPVSILLFSKLKNPAMALLALTIVQALK